MQALSALEREAESRAGEQLRSVRAHVSKQLDQLAALRNQVG